MPAKYTHNLNMCIGERCWRIEENMWISKINLWVTWVERIADDADTQGKFSDDNISVIAIWYQICIIIIFWQEEPGKVLIEKHYIDILPSSDILFVER